jgi:hypothetical protein
VKPVLAAPSRPGRTRGILLLAFLALTVAVINLSQWLVLGRVRQSLEEETGLRLTTVARAAIGEVTEELLLRPDVAEDAFVSSTLAVSARTISASFLLATDGGCSGPEPRSATSSRISLDRESFAGGRRRSGRVARASGRHRFKSACARSTTSTGRWAPCSGGGGRRSSSRLGRSARCAGSLSAAPRSVALRARHSSACRAGAAARKARCCGPRR